MMMSAQRTVGNFVKDCDDKELEEAKAASVGSVTVSGWRGMIQYIKHVQPKVCTSAQYVLRNL